MLEGVQAVLIQAVEVQAVWDCQPQVVALPER
jgi:hypothetical protein